MIVVIVFSIVECLNSGFNISHIVRHNLYDGLIEYKEKYNVLKIFKVENMVGICEVMYNYDKRSEPTNTKIIENEFENLLEEIIIRTTNISEDEIEDLVESTLRDVNTGRQDIEDDELLNLNRNDEKKIVNIFLDNKLEISVDLLRKCLGIIVSRLQVPVKFNFLNEVDLVILNTSYNSFVVKADDSYKLVLNHTKKSEKTSHLIIIIDFKNLNYIPIINWMCENYLKFEISKLYCNDDDKDSYIKGFFYVVSPVDLIFNKRPKYKRLKGFVKKYKEIFENLVIKHSEQKIKTSEELYAIDKIYDQDYLYDPRNSFSEISYDEIIYFFNELDGETFMSGFIIFELMKNHDVVTKIFKRYSENEVLKEILIRNDVFKPTEEITEHEILLRIKKINFLDRLFEENPNDQTSSILQDCLFNFKYFLTFFLVGALKYNRFEFDVLFILNPIYKIFVRNSHLFKRLEDKCLEIICNGSELYLKNPKNEINLENLRDLDSKKKKVLS